MLCTQCSTHCPLPSTNAVLNKQSPSGSLSYLSSSSLQHTYLLVAQLPLGSTGAAGSTPLSTYSLCAASCFPDFSSSGTVLLGLVVPCSPLILATFLGTLPPTHEFLQLPALLGNPPLLLDGGVEGRER